MDTLNNSSTGSPSSRDSVIPVSKCSLLVRKDYDDPFLFYVPDNVQNFVANFIDYEKVISYITSDKRSITLCTNFIADTKKRIADTKKNITYYPNRIADNKKSIDVHEMIRLCIADKRNNSAIYRELIDLLTNDSTLQQHQATLQQHQATLQRHQATLEEHQREKQKIETNNQFLASIGPEFQKIQSLCKNVKTSGKFVEFITKFNDYFLEENHSIPFTRKYGPLTLFFSNYTLKQFKKTEPFPFPESKDFWFRKIKFSENIDGKGESQLQDFIVKKIYSLISLHPKLPAEFKVIPDKGCGETLLSKHIPFKSGSTHYIGNPDIYHPTGEICTISNATNILIIVNGFIRIFIELKHKYRERSTNNDILGSLYPAARIASCHINPPTRTENDPLLPVFIIALDSFGNILAGKHTLKEWPKPSTFLKTDNTEFFVTNSPPIIDRKSVLSLYHQPLFSDVLDSILKIIEDETPIQRKPLPVDISRCYVKARSMSRYDWETEGSSSSDSEDEEDPWESNPHFFGVYVKRHIQSRLHQHPPTPINNSHIFTLTLNTPSIKFFAQDCCTAGHRNVNNSQFHVASRYCDEFKGFIYIEQTSENENIEYYVLKFRSMRQARYDLCGESIQNLRDKLAHRNQESQNSLENTSPNDPQTPPLSALEILDSPEKTLDGVLPVLIDPKHKDTCFQFALQPPYFPWQEARNALETLMRPNQTKHGDDDWVYKIHLSKYIEPCPLPNLSDDSALEPKELFKNIINTIKTIHDNGYLHFDICSDNMVYSNNTFHLTDANFLILQETVKKDTRRQASPFYTGNILGAFRESGFQLQKLTSIHLRFIDWIELFYSILYTFPGEITIDIPSLDPSADPSEKDTTFTINKTIPYNTIPLQFIKYWNRFQDLEKAILDLNWSWKTRNVEESKTCDQTRKNQTNTNTSDDDDETSDDENSDTQLQNPNFISTIILNQNTRASKMLKKIDDLHHSTTSIGSQSTHFISTLSGLKTSSTQRDGKFIVVTPKLQSFIPNPTLRDDISLNSPNPPNGNSPMHSHSPTLYKHQRTPTNLPSTHSLSSSSLPNQSFLSSPRGLHPQHRKFTATIRPTNNQFDFSTKVLSKHSGPSTCVRAVSYNSAVSGGSDGIINFWNLSANPNRALVASFHGHSSWIKCMDIVHLANDNNSLDSSSSSSHLLFTGSGRGSIGVWNLNSCILQAHRTKLAAAPSRIRPTKFLASSHSMGISAIHSDPTFLTSCSVDGSISIRDTQSLGVVSSGMIPPKRNFVSNSSFCNVVINRNSYSPHVKLLSTSSGNIHSLDSRINTLFVSTFPAHQASIPGISVSDNLLYTASVDGTVRIWDLRKFPTHHSSSIPIASSSAISIFDADAPIRSFRTIQGPNNLNHFSSDPFTLILSTNNVIQVLTVKESLEIERIGVIQSQTRNISDVSVLVKPIGSSLDLDFQKSRDSGSRPNSPQLETTSSPSYHLLTSCGDSKIRYLTFSALVSTASTI